MKSFQLVLVMTVCLVLASTRTIRRKRQTNPALGPGTSSTGSWTTQGQGQAVPFFPFSYNPYFNFDYSDWYSALMNYYNYMYRFQTMFPANTPSGTSGTGGTPTGGTLAGGTPAGGNPTGGIYSVGIPTNLDGRDGSYLTPYGVVNVDGYDVEIGR